MDEHVYTITHKVYKILEAKEPIPAEMRTYLTGLLEGILEAYKDKEAIIIKEKATLLQKLGIGHD